MGEARTRAAPARRRSPAAALPAAVGSSTSGTRPAARAARTRAAEAPAPSTCQARRRSPSGTASAAESLNEVDIPTQAEADQAASEQITEENFDEEFDKLYEEIMSDN